MRIEVGSIWTYPAADVIVIPTNGQLDSKGHLIMGAGVALEAKKRYPRLPAILARNLDENGNNCALIGEFGILSFPTKRHWRNKSDLDLIETSARQLVGYANYAKLRCIVLPAIGCGLGGLDWETQVRPILERYFDDRFVVLFPAEKEKSD